MKLLLCPRCQDIFKLAYSTRQCACGLVAGRYNEDGHTAVSNGKGISLALDNNYIIDAIFEMQDIKDAGYSDYYERARIPFWVRPNEGPGNPHSTVSEILD